MACVWSITCTLPMDYYYYYYWCFDGRRSLTLISTNQIYLSVLFASVSPVKPHRHRSFISTGPSRTTGTVPPTSWAVRRAVHHLRKATLYCGKQPNSTNFSWTLGLEWIEQSLTPHPTQYRSFRRRSSQPTNNKEKKTEYKSQKYTHKHNTNQRK